MPPCTCCRCSEPLTSEDIAQNAPGEVEPWCEFCLFEGAEDDDEQGYCLDDSMDGDHESALASAGFGTDEDYGCFSYDE